MKKQSFHNNGVVKSQGGVDAPFDGVLPNMAATHFTGQSSSQLRIGGVFGTGIQSQMIRLASEQVNLLSQIVKNTSYLGQYKPVGTTDNKKPAGGS